NPSERSVLASRVSVVRSGMAIIGFIPGKRRSERSVMPLPITLAHERIEELACLTGIQKPTVEVDVGSGNRNLLERHGNIAQTPIIYQPRAETASRPRKTGTLCSSGSAMFDVSGRTEFASNA